MFRFIGSVLLTVSAVFLSAATPSEMLLTDVLGRPNLEMRDSTGKAYLCVDTGKKRTDWQSGEKKKKKLLLDKAKISALKSQKKLLRKEGKKLKKRDETLLNVLSKRWTECRKYGPIPPVVAFDESYEGKGIAPLAVTLRVSGGNTSLPYECEVLSDEGQAKIETYGGCKLLVTPKDHVSTEVKITFRAGQEGDTRKSNTANAYVSFNQAADFNGDYLSLKPYRKKLTSSEAMHLIRWEAMGRNRDQYMALASKDDGTNLLVNELANPKSSADCEAIEAKALEIAAKEFSVFSRLASMPIDADGDGLKDLNDNGKEVKVNVRYVDEQGKKEYWTTQGGQTYMFYMLQNGCQPVREKLAMLFHNHFPVNFDYFSGPGTSRDLYIAKYLDLIRGRFEKDNSKVFPSLDKLFSKLHGDSAMLAYLDNRMNRWYQVTNENYARELMELFLLSPTDIVTKAANYIEKDIYELSYSLTGYNEYVLPEARDAGTYCCSPIDHAAGCWEDTRCVPTTKVETRFTESEWDDVLRPRAEYLFQWAPFGKFEIFKGNSYEDGHDNITPYILNQHPGAARFLAARLLATFASLTITNETLDELANLLKSDGFNVGKVLAKIMGSSAYFSDVARYDCVAAPTETFLSFSNLFNLPVSHAVSRSNTAVNLYAVVRNAINESGESTFQPPTVFGWKACGKITGGHIHNGEFWLSSQYILGRLRGFTDYLNHVDWVSGNIGFNWINLLPGDRSADSIISHFSNKIGIELKVEERELMKTYLQTISTANKTEPNGEVIPDPAKTKIVDPATLSATDFANYWSLKGPGLLELFYGLKLNHLK